MTWLRLSERSRARNGGMNLPGMKEVPEFVPESPNS